MSNPSHTYVVGVIAVIAILTLSAILRVYWSRRNRARVAAVTFTPHAPPYPPSQSTYRPSYPNGLYNGSNRNNNLPQYTPPASRPSTNYNSYNNNSFNYYPRNPSFGAVNANVPVYQPPPGPPPLSTPQPLSPSYPSYTGRDHDPDRNTRPSWAETPAPVSPYTPTFPTPHPNPAPPSPAFPSPTFPSSTPAAAHRRTPSSASSPPSPPSPASPPSRLRKPAPASTSNLDGRSATAAATPSVLNGDGRSTSAATADARAGDGGENSNSRSSKLRKPASAGAALNVVNTDAIHADGRSLTMGGASGSGGVDPGRGEASTGTGNHGGEGAGTGAGGGTQSAGGSGLGRNPTLEPPRPASPPPAYSEGGEAFMDGRD